MSDNTESTSNSDTERDRSKEMRQVLDGRNISTGKTNVLPNSVQEWMSPGILFRILSWVLVVFFGVLIIGYFLYSNDPTLYTLFIFGGFGGILYDLSDIDLAQPKKDKKDGTGETSDANESSGQSAFSRFEGIIQFPSVKRNSKGEIIHMRMGWISHALFGIAGAMVVFLIVPIEDGSAVVWAENSQGIWEATWNIKILAFALVGGYGGRALLPTLAEGYLKRATQQVVEQTEQQIKEVKQDVQQANATAQEAQKIAQNKETGLNAIIQRQELDADTLALIRQHLEPDNSPNPDQVTKIKENLPNVSPPTRENAFALARDYRHEHFEEGIKGSEKAFTLIGRVIPIFEGLIAADTEKRFHGNYGQLAYALRDKVPPEYTDAIANFDTAIEIRDSSKNPNQAPLYNIMRAVSRVALESEIHGLKEPSSELVIMQVLDDIRRGREIATIEGNTTALQLSKGEGDTEDVRKLQQWFTVNGVDPDTLMRAAG